MSEELENLGVEADNTEDVIESNLQQEKDDDSTNQGNDSTEQQSEPVISETDTTSEESDYEEILESADGKKGMVEVPSSFLKKQREVSKRLKELESEREEGLKEKLSQQQDVIQQLLAGQTQAQTPVDPYASLGEKPDKEYEPENYAVWESGAARLDNERLTQQVQQMKYQNRIVAAQRELEQREKFFEANNSGYLKRKELFINESIARAKILTGQDEAVLRTDLEQRLLSRAGQLVNMKLDPIAVLDAEFKSVIGDAGLGAEKPTPDIQAASKNTKAQTSIGKGGVKSGTSNTLLPTYEQYMSMSGKDVINLEVKLGKNGSKKLNDHLNKLNKQSVKSSGLL